MIHGLKYKQGDVDTCRDSHHNSKDPHDPAQATGNPEREPRRAAGTLRLCLFHKTRRSGEGEKATLWNMAKVY